MDQIDDNVLYDAGLKELIRMRGTLGNVLNSPKLAESWARDFSQNLVRPAHVVYLAHHTNVAILGSCDRSREQSANERTSRRNDRYADKRCAKCHTSSRNICLA